MNASRPPSSPVITVKAAMKMKPVEKEPSSSGSGSQPKAKKTSRKKEHHTPAVVQEFDPHPLPEKEGVKKKRKRDGLDTEEKHRKKTKHNKDAAVLDTDVTFTSDIPKKKRKNKTSFPDPDEDSTLPEQSQKCLAYALLQFNRPSKWKFNKARQNWLIRNIWSNELIPETYLPLTLAYLTKVQGGVRENLLGACRTALAPQVNVNPPEEKTLATTETSTTETLTAETPTMQQSEPVRIPTEAETTKKLRAQALFDSLSNPEKS